MAKGRKITGGKYKKQRKKKLYERPGQKRIVKLEKEKRKSKRVHGNNKKIFLQSGEEINVINDKGKTQKLKIENVLRTPSNRFLARQKILTKGTIVKTKKGEVRITNRPTQEGFLNGKLAE
jgi:small subunit ribosomal protein S8e